VCIPNISLHPNPISNSGVETYVHTDGRDLFITLIDKNADPNGLAISGTSLFYTEVAGTNFSKSLDFCVHL
jgi:hypothetical protein